MQHAGPFVEDPNAAEPRVPRLPINVLDGFLEARVEYRTLAASGRVTGLVNGEVESPAAAPNVHKAADCDCAPPT